MYIYIYECIYQYIDRTHKVNVIGDVKVYKELCIN